MGRHWEIRKISHEADGMNYQTTIERVKTSLIDADKRFDELYEKYRCDRSDGILLTEGMYTTEELILVQVDREVLKRRRGTKPEPKD